MMHLRAKSSGFTLVELMVAIALLLVIMLGVNQVFRSTSETISTATAVQEGVRSLRGVQSQMFVDLIGPEQSSASATSAEGIVERKNLPALVIRSEAQTLPLNKDEAQTLTPAEWRVYRKDTLSFFSKGSFKRRTGSGNVVGGDTSREAWIWYGHLKQPGYVVGAGGAYGVNDFKQPGVGDRTSNPHNYYPSDWVLGRAAVLLVGTTDPEPVIDNTSPNYWPRTVEQEPAYQSLCDLSLVNMGDRDSSKGYFEQLELLSDPSFANWWTKLSEEAGQTPALNTAYRFHGSRFVPKAANRPNGNDLALTVPMIVPGCTQFIVEFAGDYDGDPGIDTWTIGTRNGIRWYGNWRKTSLDPNSPAATYTDEDVKPVAAVLGGSLPFERNIPTSVTDPKPYICVWGPHEMNPAVSSTSPKQNAPMLIRVTVRTIDANARLGDGLVHEYVFGLK